LSAPVPGPRVPARGLQLRGDLSPAPGPTRAALAELEPAERLTPSQYRVRLLVQFQSVAVVPLAAAPIPPQACRASTWKLARPVVGRPLVAVPQAMLLTAPTRRAAEPVGWRGRKAVALGAPARQEERASLSWPDLSELHPRAGGAAPLAGLAAWQAERWLGPP
jgi:hypothetical protein